MRRYFAQLTGLPLALALGGLALPGGSCAASAATTASVPSQADAELGRIRAAVDGALTAEPPRGYAAVPPGVRVLSIARGADGQIVIDFSRELLAAGTGRPLEDALHQILRAASAVRPPSAARVDDYRVLVDGISLERYLP